ncbi:MAG TPA: ATP-binding protein, partial [Candidatus Synoicihabitans sp.]|nr:ATP-binding protein [Candidatus Synoicihabitans sp.]
EVVHRYARQLRPAMLDDLGLIPAVRSFIKDLPRRQGLRVRFSASSEVEKLDNTRRTVLYRVTQEALTNVIRHARASVVTVRIQQTADTVRLHVHDDGKSFEPARVLASAGHRRLGLLGMRERLEMVGGRLVIESSPETGTSVCADVPTVREGEAAS